MKIDFSKLTVQMAFEGPTETFDLRKDIGNCIRRNTSDIGLDELAKTIYFSDGPVDIPSEYESQLKDIISRNYIVPVQQAINELLTPKND